MISTKEMPVAVWMPQQLSPLPMFNGEEGADSRDVFKEQLKQLELITTTWKWDEPTCLVHLVTHLQGQAKTFHQSCPPLVCESYPSLVEEMKHPVNGMDWPLSCHLASSKSCGAN